MAQRHLYLQWDSTDDCNLSCLHCYHPTHIQDKSLMMLEEAKNMLNDLSNTAKRWSMVPRISISGGEPLLRKDLLEILYHAKEEGIITALLTNGTLLTPTKAKTIYDAGIRRLQISIDGKRETHNHIRNKPFAYDDALEGIVNASKAGIDVTVSMTLMQINKEDFEDVIETAIKTGAKQVGFKTYVPDKKIGLNDPEYIGAVDVLPVFRKTGELMEQYGDKITILNSDVLWKIVEPTNPRIEDAKRQNRYLTGCSAGYMALLVLSDGTVYPCRRLPIPIGNIKEGISNLIINSTVMQELRDLDKMKRNTLCDKVAYCRGCRAIAYAISGDYMAKDPMCFKHLLREKND